jgi:Ca2+-binding RTX toxin-like protein
MEKTKMPMTATQAQQLYVAYFNRPADTLGLAYWMTKDVAAASAAFAASPEYAATYAGMSTAARVDAIYTNLFGRPSEPDGLKFWGGLIESGKITVSDAVTAIAKGAQGTDLDAYNNKVKAAEAFTTALDTSAEIVGYSGAAANNAAKTWMSGITTDATLTTATTAAALNASIASVVAVGVVSVPGQTFALTTGTNVFAGGSGDDTFDAGLSTGSLQTLNSGDRLSGGTGNDELFAVLNGSVTPASMTGIERVSATVVTNASTLDLTNSSGVSSVTLAGSTAAATVSGVSKSVSVSLRDSGQAHTVTYSDVSGSADSATLNVSNLSQLTTVATTVAGVESLTINATGADSAIGLLTTDKATSLTVTGDKALNVVDNLGTTILTVNAAANTGGVNLDFGAGAVTVTGGSGNDDFSFEAAGNVTVDGGAGNDTFRFDATGTLTTADTVTGGDGIDTLRARSEELDDFTTAPTTYKITGIERITADTAVLNGAEITLGNISTTADRLNLEAANAGTATFNFNAGASTLSNKAATVGAITVDAAGTGTADSLSIIHGAASAVNSLNGQDLTSTDFETVTITTTGTGAAGNQSVGAISMTASVGGTAALVIAGSNQLTTGVITATGGSISAAGMTASTNGLIMVTGQNSASSITGSSVDDTLFGAMTTAISQTIDGGAGNDNITAGAGNDTILGGAGDDTINGGAGNDNINGGAGNDRVVISADANLNSADVIAGGDGTDTLAFTAVMTDGAATFQAISGFEVLELASGGSATVTMSNFVNNQGFTRIDFGQGGGGTLTVNNVANAVTDIRLLADSTGDTLAFDRLIDSSSNSVTISGRAAIAGITQLTINDEETVSYSGLNAAADVTITTLVAGDLKDLIVSGDGDFIVTNALTATQIRSVNASTSTGAVTFLASNSVVAVTATAGSGVFTFTGGMVADTITGGAAGDVLNGGSGADIINSGAGNDNVTGGLGADVINVGTGTDIVTLVASGSSSSLGTAASTVTAIAITGADVITGMAAGDIIAATVANYTAAGDGTTTTFLTAAATTALTADNGANLMRGSWIADTVTGSGTFVFNASGADTMYTYDADGTDNVLAFQSVILIGTTGLTGNHAYNANVITLTLA